MAGQLAQADEARSAAQQEAQDARAAVAKYEADMEGLSDAYNLLEAANARLDAQVQGAAAQGESLASAGHSRQSLMARQGHSERDAPCWPESDPHSVQHKPW